MSLTGRVESLERRAAARAASVAEVAGRLTVERAADVARRLFRGVRRRQLAAAGLAGDGGDPAALALDDGRLVELFVRYARAVRDGGDGPADRFAGCPDGAAWRRWHRETFAAIATGSE